MTTALYRRYRPESFAEVIGQEQVTGPLSVALTKNRVNHAYLFSGPRGCGKTTSARILARCLNCEQGPTPTPCGVCPSCVDLARGGPGSLDVVEIDAASHGGVDDARDLRERAAFAPVRDRYKVFIIDEAHMVSPQGFNALLKIVEEPPEHIRFIFATTEPEKVIGTIRSRTHHYPFRLVPPERLVQYLAELCEREAVPAGKGVLPLVVRAGGGSVRDTLSVLDQLIGGSGDDGLNYATAVALLGYTDSALLDDVADALAAGDGATVFRVIDRVIESGHDPRRFVEDLLERLRDLLVVAAVKDGGHAVFRGMPDDQLERMRNQAARFGAAELSRAADVTNTALTEMTGATSPRLQLELLCARLLLPAADDEQRGLGARLDRLEKRIGSGAVVSAAPVAPAAAGATASGPEPESPKSMASGLAAVRAAIGSPGRPAGGTGTAPGPDPENDAELRTPAGVTPAPVTPAPVAPPPTAVEMVPPAPRTDPEPAAAPPPAQPSAPPSAPAAPAQASVLAPNPAGGADLEAIRRNWTEVLNAVASIKRTTWSLVSQYAQVLDYDGKRLLLGFDSAGRAQSFGRGPHPAFMRQALIEVIGLDCVVEAAVSSEFRSGGQPGPSNPSSPSGPSSSSRSAAPAEATPHSAPAPASGWAERPPTPPVQTSPAQTPPAPTPEPQAAWAEVRQVPQPVRSEPAQPEASVGGGVGVATREVAAPPAAPQEAPARPRSIGAAAARAAAAAARAGQNQAASGSPQDGPGNWSRRASAAEEDRDMPTPAATPYDDIPPDLTEPVREDEAPPEGVRPSGPSVRRAQPEPQTVRPPEPTPVPQAGPPVIDLVGHSGEADGHDLDQSPLVGVQAVEQLLGGRVIEEREL